MLLTALALAFQTTALPADNFEAARLCGQAAVTAAGPATPQMQLTSRFMFYSMHAARAKPAGKDFIARLSEISALETTATLDGAAARALVPTCNQRFPRPATTPPSRLPADPFDRLIMCFGTLSLLQGAAQGMKEEQGDGAPLERIEAALNPMLAQLTDEVLDKRGLKEDRAFTEFLGKRIADSLPLGEPISVATACGVTGL